MHHQLIAMANLIQSAADAAGVSTTIQNIVTLAQTIGLGISVVFLIIVGVKFQRGGREALQDAKGHFVGIIIGIIVVAGATGIKTLIQGLNGF